MPKRLCQGYCGGYVDVRELRDIGGERFCRECRIELKRREYYGHE